MEPIEETIEDQIIRIQQELDDFDTKEQSVKKKTDDERTKEINAFYGRDNKTAGRKKRTKYKKNKKSKKIKKNKKRKSKTFLP